MLNKRKRKQTTERNIEDVIKDRPEAQNKVIKHNPNLLIV